MQDIITKVLEEVQPYSMVPPKNLAATISLALEAIENDLVGDFVECGTWKGGASFAMLLAQRYQYGKIIRPIWMFDSFQGLPKVDERDGPLAATYQRETDAEIYQNNCFASLEDIRITSKKFGFADTEAIIIPGWFSDTLPENNAILLKRRIAFLRVDCDWYEPVFQVLQDLTPLMPDESTILLDDYYAWDGCARATHDFLSQNSFSWRIRSLPELSGATMVKRPHRVGKL
jgi:O-methyltransferase